MRWIGSGWISGGVRHKAAFMLQISFQRKKVMSGLWLVTVGQHGCLLEGMCTGQAKDISLLFSEKLVLDLWQSAKVKHQGVGQLEDAKLRIWACCVTGHSSPSNMWSTYLVSICVCTKIYIKCEFGTKFEQYFLITKLDFWCCTHIEGTCARPSCTIWFSAERCQRAAAEQF